MRHRDAKNNVSYHHPQTGAKTMDSIPVNDKENTTQNRKNQQCKQE
jgi:hypothetical protein